MYSTGSIFLIFIISLVASIYGKNVETDKVIKVGNKEFTVVNHPNSYNNAKGGEDCFIYSQLQVGQAVLSKDHTTAFVKQAEDEYRVYQNVDDALTCHDSRSVLTSKAFENLGEIVFWGTRRQFLWRINNDGTVERIIGKKLLGSPHKSSQQFPIGNSQTAHVIIGDQTFSLVHVNTDPFKPITIHSGEAILSKNGHSALTLTKDFKLKHFILERVHDGTLSKSNVFVESTATLKSGESVKVKSSSSHFDIVDKHGTKRISTDMTWSNFFNEEYTKDYYWTFGDAKTNRDPKIQSKFQVVHEFKALGAEKFYFHRQPTNWVNADSICKKDGLHLAVIANHQDNEKVRSWVAKNDQAFIGMTVRGGWWHWEGTNKPISYTHWGRHFIHGHHGEHCTEVLRDGSWNDLNCYIHHRPFVCQGKKHVTTHIPKPSDHSNQFFLVSSAVPFNSASNVCKKFGLEVAVPKNDDDARAILNVANGKAWIGLQSSSKGNLIKSDHHLSKYHVKHCPNPNRCIQATNGQWNEASCDEKLNVVCQVPSSGSKNSHVKKLIEHTSKQLPTTPATTSPKEFHSVVHHFKKKFCSCPKSKPSVTYQFFHQNVKFDQAHQLCKQHGMRLATIRNPEEKQKFYDQAYDPRFGRRGKWWLGMNMVSESTKTMEWKSGNPTVSYNVWDYGQPHHSGPAYADTSNGIVWRTANAKYDYRAVACEKRHNSIFDGLSAKYHRSFYLMRKAYCPPCQEKDNTPARSADSFVVHPGRVTISTAAYNCKSRNMKIATIRNGKENRIIQSILRSQHEYAAWINLEYNEKKKMYLWNNSEKPTYTNWDPSNNEKWNFDSQSHSQFSWNLYAVIDASGQWKSEYGHSNRHLHPVVCEKIEKN